jgi:protein-S-isoprenylcysteine O-methyltransferase Ste14
MLHALRLAATALALAPVLAFADAFGRRPRRWRVARHGTRLALLAAEAALTAAWAALAFGVRADRPLLPGGLVPTAAVAGGVLAVAGGLLAAWGRRALGSQFSPTFGVLDDHALVTGGPYAVTRHPIYTGLLALVAGGALLWNSSLTLALAAGLALSFRTHAAVEERLFEGHFGEAYAAYRGRVPRLSPWPRPRGPGRGP